MTHVTISDLGDCRICARLHDLSEIVEHNSPSGHLALQVNGMEHVERASVTGLSSKKKTSKKFRYLAEFLELDKK